jgi:hypothetical protein
LYCWPDFTANFDPVTDEKYRPVKSTIAPVYIDGKRQERKIYFLIENEASGLKQPDKSLILGLHEVNSSPSKPDIAPADVKPFIQNKETCPSVSIRKTWRGNRTTITNMLQEYLQPQ